MPGKFFSRDSRVLFSLGILALLHGMIYIYVMPPWQHYDEPNHFEYVWLVASRGEIPKVKDYDPEMRRDVAVSMIENDFFARLDFLPDFDIPNGRVWIGQYSQLSNQPLYYLLASLPINLLSISDVEGQLLAARWVSWVFYLLTVLAAWGVVSEVTPKGHPLRFLVPLTLALLPGFVDVMTAVNNDTAAVGFLSLALLGSIRLVRRGFSWIIFGAVVVVSVLGFFTKELAYLAFPVLLLALLFSLFRGNNRWIAWTFLGVGLIIVTFISLTWGDAAYWYRSTSQESRTRTPEGAVLGQYAFQIDSEAETSPRWVRPLFQPIGWRDPGKTYTLGAWMWADKPVKVRTPTLCDGVEYYYSQMDLDTEPRFFATSITASELEPSRLSLALSTADPESGAIVYYDGLILVEGERSLDITPSYDDIHAHRGTWGGEPFQNMLRNASAEAGGPRFRSGIDKFFSRFTPDNTRPSALLTFFYDWEGAGWFYRISALRIFRTFWGKFGWGHVPLLGGKPYRVLGIITIMGILGLVGWFVGRIWTSRNNIPGYFNKKIPWAVAVLLGFLIVSGWSMALSRGAIYLSLVRLYMPVARYTYSAIIPTVFLLVLGWYQIINWIAMRIPTSLRNRGVVSVASFLIFLVGLDIYAIISILNYYS